MRRQREQLRTQHTLKQLKSSIDSIERMIEKSQTILKSARPLQPRQVRSESIQLRFKSHSKPKDKSRQKPKFDQSDCYRQLSTNYMSSHRVLEKCVGEQQPIKTPQKTKPMRPKIFIDTEITNEEHNDKILISDDSLSLSPILKAQNSTRKYILNSSLENLKPRKWFGEQRRMQTQALNQSREQYTANNSLQKIYNQQQSIGKYQSQRTVGPKRIILRRKINQKISNNAEFQRERKRSKNHKIFPNTSKQGKYSYYKQGPLQQCNSTSKIKQSILSSKLNPKRIVSPQQTHNHNHIQNRRLDTLNSSHQFQGCPKFQKQMRQMSLEQFLKKVKNYGFVERYLTPNQISCIYQYLKKSSIPEYKWPLYVVDEVYDKMNSRFGKPPKSKP